MNKILINFTRIAFLGFLIFELLNYFGLLNYTLDFSWLGLVVTLIVAWSGIEIINWYLKKYCRQYLSGLAILLVVGLVYFDALGDILKFYSQLGFYDQISHLVGGATAAGIVLSIILALRDCQKIKLGFFATGFFTLVSASFIGVLYELEEYFEDYFTGSHRLGDGPDTANDLFLNIVGALLIIAIISIYKKLKYVHR